MPVFFNSVFQIFMFFRLFLSQTVEEPFFVCYCSVYSAVSGFFVDHSVNFKLFTPNSTMLYSGVDGNPGTPR